MIASKSTPLDLYSTSPQNATLGALSGASGPGAECGGEAAKCTYGAPFFAYPVEPGRYAISQGSCNHWDCPRCGQIRAKHEYWRIVNGATELGEEYQLFFITITCRGKEMSLEESEANYGYWTNRFLDRARYDANKHGYPWFYAQVTERQKRGHPHSHILTTWIPHDFKDGVKMQYDRILRRMIPVPAIRSQWMFKQVQRAGLGPVYDITFVEKPEAVSRYISKYLFKETVSTIWPPGWKRVRYSQSWPKNEKMTNPDAIVLIKDEDWGELAKKARSILPRDDASREMARAFLPITLLQSVYEMSSYDKARLTMFAAS